jgi:hypothetical protein
MAMEFVKPWGDGSGDVFTVTYTPDTNEFVISSMRNYGQEREAIVKMESVDGEESFGILVRQRASDTNLESKIGLLGWGIKGAVGFGHWEGVDLRCVIYLDNWGNPFVIKLIPKKDEKRN